MARKITFEDKVTKNVSTEEDKYKITAKDVNEIKSAVNENAEEIERLNEKNILTVALAEDLELTSTIDYENFDIPLTKEVFRVGELLKISNGKIVIPAGVSKILVSAQCVSNGNANTYGIQIKKNNYQTYQSYTYPAAQTFNFLEISLGGIDVAEGDIISLAYYINNVGNTRTVFNGRTYLTVQVVK